MKKVMCNKIMKKNIAFLIIATICLLITGCGTTGKFVYPSDMRQLTVLSQEPVYNKTIAIMPFYDYRANDNSAGTIALYAIPLFPYGYCTYDRPEAASSFVSIINFDMNMSEDLAKATATSLRRSNLFENAFYTFGERKDTADFNLTGDVYVFLYKGKVFSYGLSIIGPALTLFGAPAGTSLNKIEAKLYLRKKGSQKILWEYTINKEGYYIQFLYHRMGWDVKLFSELYQLAMNDAIMDLEKQMRDNPKKFGL